MSEGVQFRFDEAGGGARGSQGKRPIWRAAVDYTRLASRSRQRLTWSAVSTVLALVIRFSIGTA